MIRLRSHVGLKEITVSRAWVESNAISNSGSCIATLHIIGNPANAALASTGTTVSKSGPTPLASTHNWPGTRTLLDFGNQRDW
jgi:hypothetical protein